MRPAWRPACWYRGGTVSRPTATSIEDAPGDHHLQCDPPQPADAFGKIAGDIHREGRVEFPHHRQREIPVVAIAVVEGETGEPPRKITLDQPPMHLIHGDDVDIVRTQMRQHRAQEFRRNFKMTVGLERGVAGRADMVQHENAADAGKHRTKQIMRAGKVKRFQSGADDVVAKLLHQGWLAGWRRDLQVSGGPLKKRLVRRLPGAIRYRLFPVISGLTALQGFVFSLVPGP